MTHAQRVYTGFERGHNARLQAAATVIILGDEFGVVVGTKQTHNCVDAAFCLGTNLARLLDHKVVSINFTKRPNRC